MDAMIAYCGLVCDTCPIHLLTLEQDEFNKRSRRAEIAKMCTEQYGVSVQVQDITDCDGCHANGRLFSGCSKCEIRKCAIEHRLANCAFCDDYACEKLLAHFESEPDTQMRLEEFRRLRR